MRAQLSSLCSALLVFGVVAAPPIARAEELIASAESEQGAGQGAGQGDGQGTELGGPTLESLGLTPDENGEIDTSVLGESDPRQGALQGVDQGATNGQTQTVDASNTQTGADSTNTSTATVSQSSDTAVANDSTTVNTGAATAETGENSASENTGPGSVRTGNAGVGVQQVTADNFTTVGSYGEIEHSAQAGSQSGDLMLSFDPAGGGDGLSDSFRSVNSVTGSGSENTADVSSSREQILEIQNDGTIINDLDVAAVTGKNDTSQNTGAATIETGSANVAATLLNFLNTNVVDGALWLSVSDIFGDLGGNVVVPETAIAYLERRGRELLVDASNATTGSASTNTVSVEVTDEQTTTLTNTANVENTVNIDAITGENEATQNTGGATVATGDVEATTNTITLANMNVVDGNLGLIIVNALNRWIGFLLGSDGTWAPIGHAYSTLIEAANTATGSESTNTAEVTVDSEEITTVTNDATVKNTLDIDAITGQNTASQNTGNASVTTGDAHVYATVVNVVNTNVVRGGFFAAIVNVFGNWFGDLWFGGTPVTALASARAAASAPSGGVEIAAENASTGSDSTNTIDIDASSESTVEVDNTAKITNALHLNADTGHNQTSRNTGLGSVKTGDVLAALHARNVANVSLVGMDTPWANITADLVNATTGADSTNTIDVTIDDTREVTVLNDAEVDTAIGAVANTGFNTANRNTLGGLICTGVAALDALVDNLLNQTWLVRTYGDGQAQLATTNTQTGSGSGNSIGLTPFVSTAATVGNTADADTTFTAAATTGDNQANRNTGGTHASCPTTSGASPPVSSPPSSGSGGPLAAGTGGGGASASAPSGGGGGEGGGGSSEEAPVQQKIVKKKAKSQRAKVRGIRRARPGQRGVAPSTLVPRPVWKGVGRHVLRAFPVARAAAPAQITVPSLASAQAPQPPAHQGRIGTWVRWWPWVAIGAAAFLLL